MRLALAALVIASPAMATDSGHFIDGNNLQSLCRADRAYVTAYVVGATDAFNVTFVGQKKYICLPLTITSTQLSDMLCKYVDDNPEQRHLPAGGISYGMLVKYFHCPV